MERKKVLMATTPFDGHFNPLTTLALALKEVGFVVRWYTQEKYTPKLAKLQIPHFPFRNALQFHDGNMDEHVDPQFKGAKRSGVKLIINNSSIHN